MTTVRLFENHWCKFCSGDGSTDWHFQNVLSQNNQKNVIGNQFCFVFEKLCKSYPAKNEILSKSALAFHTEPHESQPSPNNRPLAGHFQNYGLFFRQFLNSATGQFVDTFRQLQLFSENALPQFIIMLPTTEPRYMTARTSWCCGWSRFARLESPPGPPALGRHSGASASWSSCNTRSAPTSKRTPRSTAGRLQWALQQLPRGTVSLETGGKGLSANLLCTCPRSRS